jgi:hypothetical protein
VLKATSKAAQDIVKEYLAILHSVLRSLKVLEELVLRTLLQIEVG